MKRLLFSFFLLLSISATSFAENVCVLPNGAGAKNGADWSNAADWGTMTFTRGNTYYLAGGEYATKTLNTEESDSTYVYIKKATTVSHVTDVGWESSMGDENAATFPGLLISTGYWDLDGVTGNGASASSYGFAISIPSNCDTKNNQIYLSGNISNIKLRHFDIENCGSSYNYSQTQIYHVATSPVSGMEISYNYLHEAGHNLLIRNWTNSEITHNYFQNNWSSAENHGESISTDYEDNITYAYNVWDNACNGTGCISPGKGPGTGHINSNGKIYNNIIKTCTSVASGGNGVLGCDSSQVCNDYVVYGNTIVNFSNCNAGITQGTEGSGTLTKNNIFYNCNNITIQGTHDYNAYSGSVASGDGGHSIADLSNPFTNYLGGDFRLVAEAGVIDMGTTLTSPYNTDHNGITRPRRNGYDIGAYEYAGNHTLGSGPQFSIGSGSTVTIQ